MKRAASPRDPENPGVHGEAALLLLMSLGCSCPWASEPAARGRWQRGGKTVRAGVPGRHPPYRLPDRRTHSSRALRLFAPGALRGGELTSRARGAGRVRGAGRARSGDRVRNVGEGLEGQFLLAIAITGQRPERPDPLGIERIVDRRDRGADRGNLSRPHGPDRLVGMAAARDVICVHVCANDPTAQQMRPLRLNRRRFRGGGCSPPFAPKPAPLSRRWLLAVGVAQLVVAVGGGCS